MSDKPLQDTYRQEAFKNEAIVQILAVVRRIEKQLEDIKAKLEDRP